jgi:uncharacterized membrane protein
MIDPSFDSVSQYAHFGWGYFLVTMPVLLIHVAFPAASVWWLLCIMAGLVAIGTGIKEYWDGHGLETPDVAGNSWKDFAFWNIGTATAVLVLAVFFGFARA